MIKSGRYRIVSLIEGKPPTGVNFTKPAWQTVRLNQPVQTWTLKTVNDNVFQLSIGGYAYTGAVDNTMVTASIYPEHNMEFHATYREAQGGYTIELADDRSKAWTAPSDLSVNSGVQIRPIISIRSSSSQFLPTQLFSFQPVEG